jgi:proteasome lid subunit RPN8/RPN11
MNISQESIVSMSNSNFKVLKNHTIAYYPKEACALLFGKNITNNYEIKQVIKMPNRMRTPYKFGISRDDKQKAIELANYPLIGVYHSHRNESEPSTGDIKGMSKADNLWLIGYLKKNEINTDFFKVKAYYLNNSKIYNLKMEAQ